MSEAGVLPLRGAVSVKEFCQWASIGRTAAYEEIARGRLRARKAGKRTLIPMSEAQRWLDSLPTHEEQLDQRDAASGYPNRDGE